MLEIVIDFSSAISVDSIGIDAQPMLGEPDQSIVT
jgi:hypothetical protein